METFRETFVRAINIYRISVIPSEVEESLIILPQLARDVSTSLDMTERTLGVDTHRFVCSYRAMRWWFVGALILFNVSCATVANQRDRFRPHPRHQYDANDIPRIVEKRTSAKMRRTREAPPASPDSIVPEEEPVLPPP